MDLISAITTFNTFASATQHVLKIRTWLSTKLGTKSADAINEVLQQLPTTATPEQIASALTPLYLSENDLLFKAGNNNGGDMNFNNAVIEAGNGAKIIVAGGDGGERGKGGNVNINRTTFKGGNRVE